MRTVWGAGNTSSAAAPADARGGRDIRSVRDQPRRIVSTTESAGYVSTVPWRIGVVVPAKNEAVHLPGCLAALTQAAVRVSAVVCIVVVLDSCTDASGDAVHAARAALPTSVTGGVELDALAVEFSNVGAVRAAGANYLIAQNPPGSLWLANTDADSTVPAHWLSGQLAHARAGADAVAGTVTVSDWGDRPPAVIRQANTEYRKRLVGSTDAQGSTGHGHVHGANLGVTADAYLQVGGFAALAVHEDVALLAAVAAAGRRIEWAEDIAVTTSARRHSRTRGGFASYLHALENPAPLQPTSLARKERRSAGVSARIHAAVTAPTVAS